MMLSLFVYKKSDVTIDVVDMNNKINIAFTVETFVNLMLAITLFMLVYVFILAITWWMERRDIVPELFGYSFRPFKVFTLFMGDANKIRPAHMLIIILISIVILVSILSGVYFVLLQKFLTIVVDTAGRIL